uniref:Uncharacterized protein n=1 Tax=Mycena chlorophos TaxID=658473 RepID=A0ABQ0L068_MYCCL|nr:predicted protein [Mycena chlorophos]
MFASSAGKLFLPFPSSESNLQSKVKTANSTASTRRTAATTTASSRRAVRARAAAICPRTSTHQCTPGRLIPILPSAVEQQRQQLDHATAAPHIHQHIVLGSDELAADFALLCINLLAQRRNIVLAGAAYPSEPPAELAAVESGHQRSDGRSKPDAAGPGREADVHHVHPGCEAAQHGGRGANNLPNKHEWKDRGAPCAYGPALLVAAWTVVALNHSEPVYNLVHNLMPLHVLQLPPQRRWLWAQEWFSEYDSLRNYHKVFMNLASARNLVS